MLRGDGVRNNFIENVTSYSFGGLAIQNSCRYNTFNRCKIKNTYYWKHPIYSSIARYGGVSLGTSYYGDTAIANLPSPETDSYPWEVNYGASFNKFTNCIFENVSCGIELNNHQEYEYPAYHALAGQATDRIYRKRIVGNEFINCTFVGRSDEVDIFLTATRGNDQNKLINCIVTGFNSYESRPNPGSTTTVVVAKSGIIPTNFSYVNCLFYNNGFDAFVPANGTIAPVANPPLIPGFSNSVAGTFINNIISTDPQFVNPILRDYHLIASSPCINTGTTVTLTKDYDNNTRPCNVLYDIGALEFQNCNIGIKEVENLIARISVYPNPGTGNFTIITSEDAELMQLFTVEGKLVTQMYKPKESTQLNLTNMEAGIYFLKIKFLNSEGSQKLILIK